MGKERRSRALGVPGRLRWWKITRGPRIAPSTRSSSRAPCTSCTPSGSNRKRACGRPRRNWTWSGSGSKLRRNTMRNGVQPRKAKRAEEVEASSGNVFADLELPDADEALAKAELAGRICAILAERKL